MRERADKEGLEAWLKAHPQEGRALMRENRSFIFFRETALDESDGPMGAAGIPLSRLRSLAVDRTLHTFHTPVFVEAPDLADPERGAPFRRLLIAQDTGSAIVGPARGDIFFGSGVAAGSLAGKVRHAARMIALVPARQDSA
jgi:membrane-bound lytic murein transglycosylase A